MRPLGVLMSISDAGVKSLDVVGPQGLNHFLASTRSYAMRSVYLNLTYRLRVNGR